LLLLLRLSGAAAEDVGGLLLLLWLSEERHGGTNKDAMCVLTSETNNRSQPDLAIYCKCWRQSNGFLAAVSDTYPYTTGHIFGQDLRALRQMVLCPGLMPRLGCNAA
jgi:hypothetical protein